MPERLSNEEVVRRYAAASVAADVEAMSALRHPAWSVTWPQSGERVVREDAYREILQHYPGGAPRTVTTRIVGAQDRWVVTPGNTVVRVVGEGDAWWCEWRVTYPDEITYLCIDLIELRDALVHRETVYWAPVFHPPAWRAAWVEPADAPTVRDDP
jgi:hypothetical protein